MFGTDIHVAVGGRTIRKKRGVGGECQTGNRETIFIHIKNNKCNNQGRNSQKEFLLTCSSEMILDCVLFT